MEKTIGERLRDEFKRLNLSLTEASKEIESMSPNQLSNICTGRRRLTAEELVELAAIGVDIQYLLYGVSIQKVDPAKSSNNFSIEETELVEIYRQTNNKNRKIIQALFKEVGNNRLSETNTQHDEICTLRVQIVAGSLSNDELELVRKLRKVDEEKKRMLSALIHSTSHKR